MTYTGGLGNGRVNLARTFDELLKVDGAEGRDGDGGPWPERWLAFVISSSVPLEIPQARGGHERKIHRTADAGRRTAAWCERRSAAARSGSWSGGDAKVDCSGAVLSGDGIRREIG